MRIYESHTDDIRVHTNTYESHMDDLRYMPVTYK